MAESETTGQAPGEAAQDGGPSTREHAGYGRSSIREQTDRITQRARETGQQAKETAERKAEELKQQAERAADDLTSRMGGRVSSFARVLRRAGEELRGEGETRFAELIDQGAGHAERMGSYLDGKKPDQMMADFEGMARSNPAFFVGGTFAMGLLFGRFLRSSEPAADIVFEPEGDWAVDGGSEGPSTDGAGPPTREGRPEQTDGASGRARVYEPPDPGLGEGPNVDAAVTSERERPERAMTPDLENISAEHPATPSADEHLDEETPARTAFPGHETRGPGVRTGSSGAAALDAGSAGPRQGERNLRPMRRRSDREGR